MKLEKREITLNERDSLSEAYNTQGQLLSAYAALLWKAEKKETRATLLRLMTETGEDLYRIADLLEERGGENL